MSKCLNKMTKIRKRFIQDKELLIGLKRILLFLLWKFNKIKENAMREMNLLKKKKIR
jgi:hypothetical protein